VYLVVPLRDPVQSRQCKNYRKKWKGMLKLRINALCNFVSITGPDIQLLQMEIY